VFDPTSKDPRSARVERQDLVYDRLERRDPRLLLLIGRGLEIMDRVVVLVGLESLGAVDGARRLAHEPAAEAGHVCEPKVPAEPFVKASLL